MFYSSLNLVRFSRASEIRGGRKKENRKKNKRVHKLVRSLLAIIGFSPPSIELTVEGEKAIKMANLASCSLPRFRLPSFSSCLRATAFPFLRVVLSSLLATIAR